MRDTFCYRVVYLQRKTECNQNQRASTEKWGIRNFGLAFNILGEMKIVMLEFCYFYS